MDTRPVSASSPGAGPIAGPSAGPGAAAADLRRSPSALAVSAATAVVLALTCLPLLLAAQLPLVDMPAHMARLEILDQLLKGGPLAQFYAFEPGLVPNLVFDGVGLALLQVLPIDLVGAIYLATTLALQLLGTMLLHRTLHGRYSYWPLAAALLLYNLSFFYGFLSYLAGVGLTLLALALWIRLRDRPAAVRVAAGSIAAMLLFFAHIVPLIVYAAAVAGYELQAAAGLRHRPMTALGRLSVGAAQFLLPGALFLGKTLTVGLAREAPAFDLEGKLGSLLATATSGAAGLDIYTLAAVAIGLLLAPFAFHLRFAKQIGAAMLLVLFAFAVMPWGMGPVVNLDIRMPLAIFLIAIAAIDVTLKRPRLGGALTCILAATVLARVVGVSIEAAQFPARLDAYRAAFQRLPDAGILFTGVNDRCAAPPIPGHACREHENPPPDSLIGAPLRLLYPGIYRRRIDVPPNIAAFASIDRDVFVPQIFATRGLQPIGIREPLARLKTLQENNPIEIRTNERMQAVTAALLEAAHAALPRRPVFLLQQWIEGAAEFAPEGAELVARGPQFALYRIAPGSR